MVADNPKFKIPEAIQTIVAWSDRKDRVIIKHLNKQYSYDTKDAIKLMRDLEVAIKDSI